MSKRVGACLGTICSVCTVARCCEAFKATFVTSVDLSAILSTSIKCILYSNSKEDLTVF